MGCSYGMSCSNSQAVESPPHSLVRRIQTPCGLARFPARWNHLAEKESRHINMLEQIFIGEVMQLRRDLLKVPLKRAHALTFPALSSYNPAQFLDQR